MATKKSDMPAGAELPPKPEPEPGSSDGAGETCPICLGPKVNPMALPCTHSFCMICLEFLAVNTFLRDLGDGLLEMQRCPVCRNWFCISQTFANFQS